MKALKDCNWNVEIMGANRMCWFCAETTGEVGIDNLFVGRNSKSRSSAIRQWRKFAKLNGIKKYKIIGG